MVITMQTRRSKHAQQKRRRTAKNRKVRRSNQHTHKRIRSKGGTRNSGKTPIPCRKSACRYNPYKQPQKILQELMQHTTIDSLIKSCATSVIQHKYRNGYIYKACTDKFLALSYILFKENGDVLPNKWYTDVIRNLKTYDYSDYSSLYFNILLGICLNAEDYMKAYPVDFLSKLLMGMEESAVTGIYNVTRMPRVKNCLKNLGAHDTSTLSNTNLLIAINKQMKPSEMNYIDDEQSLASSDEKKTN